MCVYVHKHAHLWKAQSVNTDFPDLRGNECVLIRDMHPRAQIGEDSSAFSRTPYTLAILLPELQFLNQKLYTTGKRVFGMCLPKGPTTKRGHFSMSTSEPSGSTFPSGL